MSVFTNPATGAAEHAQAYVGAVLDLLGDREPISILHRTPAELAAATANLSAEELKQPEAPGKWSIRHVLQHLVDSEIVWAYRMRMVIAHDRPRLSGYDQDLWADRLGYDEVDPAEALEEFATFRTSNLRLLDRIPTMDLNRVGIHEERGEQSIDLLLRLYAGHDLLHLRQVERIRRAVTRELGTAGSSIG